MKAYLVLCTGIQMSLFECELVLPGQFFQVLDYSHLLVPPLAKIVQYIKKLIRLHIPWMRTDGDVVNDEQITSQEVQIFMSVLEVDKDTPILDLCCGQGRHVLEMARLGYWNVHGMERSHYLISRARNFEVMEIRRAHG